MCVCGSFGPFWLGHAYYRDVLQEVFSLLASPRRAGMLRKTFCAYLMMSSSIIGYMKSCTASVRLRLAEAYPETIMTYVHEA